jgi:hypothetical protein
MSERLGLHQIEGGGATSGQVPVWNPNTEEWEPGTASGGGGTVDSIVAGTGISVDSTDPANPVISATGGGSGSLTVQDENANVATGVTQIDFQGAGVTATAGTGEVVVTIPGGGSSVTWSQLIAPFRGDGHFLLRTNVGTWGTYSSFTAPIGGGGIYNSSHVVGDSVAFLMFIDPGTYTLNVFGDAATTRAIVTYEVETAPGSGSYTSLGTIDWYAAASSGFNTLKSLTGLTIGGTGGWRNLRCRVTGKNASGTDYYEFIQALQLLRTA